MSRKTLYLGFNTKGRYLIVLISNVPYFLNLYKLPPLIQHDKGCLSCLQTMKKRDKCHKITVGLSRQQQEK